MRELQRHAAGQAAERSFAGLALLLPRRLVPAAADWPAARVPVFTLTWQHIESCRSAPKALVARRFRTAKPVSAPFGFSGSPSRCCGARGPRGCSRHCDPLRGRLDSGHVPEPRRRQDARFGSERCSTASTRRRRPMNDDDSCGRRAGRTADRRAVAAVVRVVSVEPGGGRCSKEQVVEDEELAGEAQCSVTRRQVPSPPVARSAGRVRSPGQITAPTASRSRPAAADPACRSTGPYAPPPRYTTSNDAAVVDAGALRPLGDQSPGRASSGTARASRSTDAVLVRRREDAPGAGAS